MASKQLENKSARILIVNIGGGASITVPPTDAASGSPAVVVKLEDKETDAFDKALQTPPVQDWIDAGELVVSDAPDPEPASKQPARGHAQDAPDPEPAPKQPAHGHAQPERKKHGLFGGSDKDKEP